MSQHVILSKLPSASDLELYGLTNNDMHNLFGESTCRQLVPDDFDCSEEDAKKYCSKGMTGKCDRFPNGYMAIWMDGGFALPFEWFMVVERK